MMLSSALKHKRKGQKSTYIPQQDLISFDMDTGVPYTVSYPAQQTAIHDAHTSAPNATVDGFRYMPEDPPLYPVEQGIPVSYSCGNVTQANPGKKRIMASKTPIGLSKSTPTPQPRKTPTIQSKQGPVSHSALSLVKKAAAGIHEQSTPYYKAIYQDKRIVETLDKYILAQSEGVDTWATYMKDEKNPAIQSMYQNVGELNQMWVKLQLKYRNELPEERRLFKRLMMGEHEIKKLYKQVISTALKEKKIGKQQDDALAKNTSKGIDLKKLEVIQRDLNKAHQDHQMAHQQYTSGKNNHEKFRNNEIKKMMINLAEAEISLHMDCTKIAETKLKLCKLYMVPQSNESSGDNIHKGWYDYVVIYQTKKFADSFMELHGQIGKVSSEARLLIGNLYRGLGIPCPNDSEQERPPQPRHVQLHKTPAHSDPSLPVPSAPMPDESTVSVGNLQFTDAVYIPIPEEDSDPEDGADYIYAFADDEFDPEIYENVEQTMPSYLELVDDSHVGRPTISEVNPPRIPPRQSFQPPATEDDTYEETDLMNSPAIIQSRPGTADDNEIFGTIGGFRLAGRAPGPQEEYSYAVPHSHHHDHDEAETYDNMWDARTGCSEDGSSLSSGVSSVPSRASSTGSNTSISRTRAIKYRNASMACVDEQRYVQYSGSAGDKPARQPVNDATGNIEAALRKSLLEFNNRKSNCEDQPPPLPARR